MHAVVAKNTPAPRERRERPILHFDDEKRVMNFSEEEGSMSSAEVVCVDVAFDLVVKELLNSNSAK